MSEILRYKLSNPHRLPSPYIPLSFLQSTGTQWIDTKWKATNKTKVIIDYQLTATPDSSHLLRLFGARTSAGSNSFVAAFTDSGTNSTYFDCCGEHGITGKGNLNKHTIILDGNHWSIDYDRKTPANSFYDHTFTATTFTTSGNCYLFAYNDNGTALKSTYAKIYSCKIWEDGSLVRDFVPCSNGTTCGLFDLVTQTFYTNAGTGDFTAGTPLIAIDPSYQQVEWIKTGSTLTDSTSTVVTCYRRNDMMPGLYTVSTGDFEAKEGFILGPTASSGGLVERNCAGAGLYEPLLDSEGRAVMANLPDGTRLRWRQMVNVTSSFYKNWTARGANYGQTARATENSVIFTDGTSSPNNVAYKNLLILQSGVTYIVLWDMICNRTGSIRFGLGNSNYSNYSSTIYNPKTGERHTYIHRWNSSKVGGCNVLYTTEPSTPEIDKTAELFYIHVFDMQTLFSLCPQYLTQITTATAFQSMFWSQGTEASKELGYTPYTDDPIECVVYSGKIYRMDLKINRNGLPYNIHSTPLNPGNDDSSSAIGRNEGGTDFSNGYIQSKADLSTLCNSRNYTISFWMYPTELPADESATNWKRIFCVRNNGDSNQGLQLVVYLTKTSIGSSFYGDDTAKTVPGLAVNLWVHVAITQSGATQTVYANGTSLGTNSKGTSSVLSGSHFDIGKCVDRDMGQFKGCLYDFRIFDTALTPDEIKAIYLAK